MYATKETARAALEAFNRIYDEHDGYSEDGRAVKDAVAKVRDFLAAAEKRLPTQESVDRDRKRKRSKSKAE